MLIKRNQKYAYFNITRNSIYQGGYILAYVPPHQSTERTILTAVPKIDAIYQLSEAEQVIYVNISSNSIEDLQVLAEKKYEDFTTLVKKIRDHRNMNLALRG